jgi:hypothetical protein
MIGNDYLQNQTGRSIFAGQEGQEGVRKSHEAVEVDTNFILELIEVEFGGIAHVINMLNTRIQKDTVDVRESLGNAFFGSASRFSVQGLVNLYVSTKPGIAFMSARSNATLLALSSPYMRTNSSKRSCRRPTAVTLRPLSASRSAIARPIPEVAPMRRTCLYGKAMVARQVYIV